MTTDASSEALDGLASLADELLAWAERLFGPKALTEWTFVGVEINERPPYLAYYPDNSWVAVSLSPRAIYDADQCVFQLAHEVAHLLYPTVDRHAMRLPPTIVLNEGVSTYFSIVALQGLRSEEAAHQALESLRIHSPNYFNALTMVSRVLQTDADAIKKLRQVQPMLNSTIEQDFVSAGIDLEPEAAAALLAIF